MTACWLSSLAWWTQWIVPSNANPASPKRTVVLHQASRLGSELVCTSVRSSCALEISLAKGQSRSEIAGRGHSSRGVHFGSRTAYARDPFASRFHDLGASPSKMLRAPDVSRAAQQIVRIQRARGGPATGVSALSTNRAGSLYVANDRQMTLTPELVARVHRAIEDTGPEEGVSYHTDEDYDACVSTILAQRHSARPIWLFAYGSLIWKPEIEHVEKRAGSVRGWHRSFCYGRPAGEVRKSSPA